MKLPRPARRWLGGLALAVVLAAGPGCMRAFHPIRPPEPVLCEACRTQPKCCRDHVYIFLVHGMDPLDFANIDGLKNYLNNLGFHKTYYGQLCHGPRFTKEVRRIHAEDPEAKFVLAGFSFGANVVRSLAQDVKAEGVCIDLLVYLGGNTLENTPRDRPDNARRLVNILAKGCIWNGTTFDDAENTHLADVYHFGSPTHPHTLEMLARELAVVAGEVPVVAPPAVPDGETAPTPRPVTARAGEERDEWDFLKPVSRLDPPTPAKAATAAQSAQPEKGIAARPRSPADKDEP